MNIRIPTKHYKVLLVQLMIRFTEALLVTYCGSNSRRHTLTEVCLISLKDLERELKKDCTLRESAVAKKKMFDCLYIGHLPDWFERIFMEALREESVKLDRKDQQEEIQQMFFDEDLVDTPVPMTVKPNEPEQVKLPDQVDPNKKPEDAEKGDVWEHEDECYLVNQGGNTWWYQEEVTHLMGGRNSWNSSALDSSDHNLKYLGNILKGTFKEPSEVVHV